MHRSSSAPKPMPPIVLFALVVWAVVALVVGLSGRFYDVSAQTVALVNATLVVLSLVLLFFEPSARAWAASGSLRLLILFHAIRIVAGAWFLWLLQQGALPQLFAIIAGWGDISVGIVALLVGIFAVPMTTPTRWWIVLGWNIAGIADILRVLSTGMQTARADPGAMQIMTAFPQSLLPTLIVPLIIVTHLLIFARLWQTRLVLSH